MRDIFVLLVLFSTIPLVFIRPHVGILAWCWVSYMNPHRLSWGFAYEFPVAMVVGSATLVAWMLSKEPKRLPIDWVSGLLLTFVFWISFANLFALSPEDAFEKWWQSIKILLMTFVTMALITNRQRVHALVWVIVTSLAFFGIKGGAFTILKGGVSHVWGPPRSFIGDNNALAMALLMALPLMWYLVVHTRSKAIRYSLYGSTILMFFSIIGSQSRGAFLGMAAMVLFLLLKSRQRVLLGLGLAVVLAGAIAFVPQKWVDRMRSIETYQEDRSARARLSVWEFGIKVALDRPIVGGGFRVSYDKDIFLRYVPDAKLGVAANFHSVYFELLGELGFVGLFVYLLLMIAAWRTGSRIIALTRDRTDLQWANDLARMVQVSLVGFAIAGAFQNLAFFDLYFHLIAIIFVTRWIVQQSIQGTMARGGVPEPMSRKLVAFAGAPMSKKGDAA